MNRLVPVVAAIIVAILVALAVPWVLYGFDVYNDWVWCHTNTVEEWPNTYHDPLFHGCP